MEKYKQQMEQMIEIVRSQGASDLHLSIGRHPTIRVAGTLIPLQNMPVLSGNDTLELLTTMLSKEQKERFLKEKELDYSYSADQVTRFRGNAFVQRSGVGVALRYIPRKIPTLQELSLPEILQDFAYMKQGFFLVVGPVGQGKTTTLASMVDLINTNRQEHILTVEDPIEYIHVQKQSIVDQREVGVDTAGFPEALHSAFRQDANVIMLGELRNLDTISSAITAAETGHLVFATLHTNDAPQTIDRIIDVFPTGQQRQIRAQLAAALSGIFSQRLIPGIETGVVPTYELLINNAAISNLIRDERTHEIQSVIETGSKEGMIHMDRSLAERVKGGLIAQETAMRYAQNPDNLMRYINH